MHFFVLNIYNIKEIIETSRIWKSYEDLGNFVYQRYLVDMVSFDVFGDLKDCGDVGDFEVYQIQEIKETLEI